MPLPGIEPGSSRPQRDVLPLYYNGNYAFYQNRTGDLLLTRQTLCHLSQEGNYYWVLYFVVVLCGQLGCSIYANFEN
ncbi:hypothetical protein BB559_002821 [Furculomyces boomerangus]|uniref:Uncharacterized protein n=1 Tax=Furculomyces boomerangus TaxID=61424 RepID=A0A2T9YS52_9FUNG|nr:hypothetical protein BB559_002821 [Furculomyces boomerangus]